MRPSELCCLCLITFETGSHYIAQDEFQFKTLLPSIGITGFGCFGCCCFVVETFLELLDYPAVEY